MQADDSDIRPASTTIDRALERHAMEVAAWSAPENRALPDPFPQWNPTLDSAPQVEMLERYAQNATPFQPAGEYKRDHSVGHG